MKQALQPSLFKEDLEIRSLLIVINPPKAISEYVSGLKDEIVQKHGSFDSAFSIPHITVCHFPILEQRIEKILAQITERISVLNSFTLTVSGFSSFANASKKTFFMKVIGNDLYDNLKSEFKAINKEIIKTKKFSLTHKPHITVAKSLNAELFRKINSQYGSDRYEMEFEVNSLTVLKYIWQEKKYHKIEEINLTN